MHQWISALNSYYYPYVAYHLAHERLLYPALGIAPDEKVTESHVHATLAEIVAGLKPGRTDDRQITLFDSTGMGLQDVSAAAAIYRRALQQGVGVRLTLS